MVRDGLGRIAIVAAAVGVVAALGAATPVAASVGPGTTSNDRLQSVSATVPNAFVRVYACSELGTRCRLVRTEQLNAPFNGAAPSVYVNRFIGETSQRHAPGPRRGGRNRHQGQGEALA